MLREIVAALLLTGCVTSPLPPQKVPEYHPPLPRPYEVCDVRWEVLEVGGKVKVALSYEDNINLAICQKDIERYISQLVGVVCNYQNNKTICSEE